MNIFLMLLFVAVVGYVAISLKEAITYPTSDSNMNGLSYGATLISTVPLLFGGLG